VCGAGLLAALVSSGNAVAQNYEAARADRQWITVSYDWLYSWPLHFDNYPLEDLVGAPVDEAAPPFDYRTADGGTLIDVLEFRRRGRGVGVTIYPFGMTVGSTLGLRGSIENLPDMRIAFEGPGRPLSSYTFTNGRAHDVVQSGPVGFEVSVKFGWNKLSEPLEHRFLSVPINMRATVSF
jgi:hypothetical protein